MPSTAATPAPAIPVAANARLLSLVIGANLVCGLVLPLLLLPRAPGWLVLLLPFVLLTVPHWALIHEAVHGHLHPDRRLNEGLGRLLGVLFGGAFAALRFGHLSHHSLNSKPAERPEIYDPSASGRLGTALLFYFRLFIGIYLAETLSSLLCFLPRRWLVPLVRRLFYEGAPDVRGMPDRAERQLLAPQNLAVMRRDSTLALAWLGTCLWAYGQLWWVFGLALLGRGFVVSLMDNAPHYAGPIDDYDQGYDMRAPWPVSALILNTNLHGTHHRYPNLPWTALPGAFAADRAPYAGSYFLIPWRQLRGPIPLEAAAAPRPEALAA